MRGGASVPPRFFIASSALEAWRTSPPAAAEVSRIQNALCLQAYWCYLSSAVPNDGLGAPSGLSCVAFGDQIPFLREHIHVLIWSPPETGGSPSAYRICDVTGGKRIFLAEPASGHRAYFRRRAAGLERFFRYVIMLEEKPVS